VLGASPLRDIKQPRGDAEACCNRLAIVGVGRAGQADDGAGPALCAALQKLGGSHPDRLVVDGGAAPENVTGLLRRFRPDVVVLVDAAAMSERPGAVRWLERGCALGCSASTHTLPLGMLATYLRESLGCDVRLLGIQPAVIGEEGPLSAPVRRTVERLARRLTMVKERSG
jgi:hydrogenase maturation protease HycI